MQHEYDCFDVSYAYGHDAEGLICTTLTNAGHTSYMMDRRALGDLWCIINDGDNTHPEIIEVKCEDKQAGTGHIFIERCQGDRNNPKHSGSASSEATVWLHTLGSMCAIYRAMPMRCYLHNRIWQWGKFTNTPPPRKITCGDNNNQGYLVPIADCTPYPWFDHCPLDSFPSSPVWNCTTVGDIY